MKRTLVIPCVAAVFGGLLLASNASAQVATGLRYFDAQILEIPPAKMGGMPTPPNTMFADGTPFTAQHYDPREEIDDGMGGMMPNPDFNPDGNWTLNNLTAPGGTGTDGFWNRRINPEFGNNDDVLEARGQNGGPNDEVTPVLKTTINVPLADQGSLRSVWALIWADGSPWQVAASLVAGEQHQLPVFAANVATPAGYVFQAYDPGDPNATNGVTFDSAAVLSTTDPSGNRSMWAALLGDVELEEMLTVYVGHGPPFTPEQLAANGGANSRTWYDGIAYGPPMGLPAIPNIPEPASLVLVGLALAGLGMMRRKRGC